MILRFAGDSGISASAFGISASIGKESDLSIDAMFLSIGTTVGFCILVTVTIIAHAIGERISLVELATDAMAVLLFSAVGIIGVASSVKSKSGLLGLGFVPNPLGNGGTDYLLALGIISFLTSVVFLVDLILIVRNTKVSFLPK